MAHLLFALAFQCAIAAMVVRGTCHSTCTMLCTAQQPSRKTPQPCGMRKQGLPNQAGLACAPNSACAIKSSMRNPSAVCLAHVACATHGTCAINSGMPNPSAQHTCCTCQCSPMPQRPLLKDFGQLAHKSHRSVIKVAANPNNKGEQGGKTAAEQGHSRNSQKQLSLCSMHCLAHA